MANTCTDYCVDDPIGDYETISCGDNPSGGLPAMILLECNHQLTDPSDEAEVQAELDAGRAHLIEGVSLSIDAPTPVTRESNSPCDSNPILITYDWKGTYDNDNITTTNIDFHNQLFDGRRFAGVIVQECTESDDTHYVSWIDATVTFRGGRVIGKKKADGQKFTGEFSYQSKYSAQRYEEPTGIFS
jgi:hypothetical protein